MLVVVSVDAHFVVIVHISDHFIILFLLKSTNSLHSAHTATRLCPCLLQLLRCSPLSPNQRFVVPVFMFFCCCILYASILSSVCLYVCVCMCIQESIRHSTVYLPELTTGCCSYRLLLPFVVLIVIVAVVVAVIAAPPLPRSLWSLQRPSKTLCGWLKAHFAIRESQLNNNNNNKQNGNKSKTDGNKYYNSNKNVTQTTIIKATK